MSGSVNYGDEYGTDERDGAGSGSVVGSAEDYAGAAGGNMSGMYLSQTEVSADDEDGRSFELEDAAAVTGEADLRHEDEASDQQSIAMFEGDTGTLYPEQRQALNKILKNKYISREKHPDTWHTLLEHQALLKSRLNDLFLELTVDTVHEIAYKTQARRETGDALPTLLRDTSLSKEETVIMVFLRQRFFARRQDGDEYVFVDRSSMLEQVAEKRPEDATNRAGDHRRADNAVEKLTSAGMLLKTDDPDRFRISPIIEALLPLEKLQSLLAWLTGANQSARGATDAERTAAGAGDGAERFESESRDGFLLDNGKRDRASGSAGGSGNGRNSESSRNSGRNTPQGNALLTALEDWRDQ